MESLTLEINPTDSGLPANFVINAVTESAEEWDSHTEAELVSATAVSYTASVDDETTASDSRPWEYWDNCTMHLLGKSIHQRNLGF